MDANHRLHEIALQFDVERKELIEDYPGIVKQYRIYTWTRNIDFLCLLTLFLFGISFGVFFFIYLFLLITSTVEGIFNYNVLMTGTVLTVGLVYLLKLNGRIRNRFAKDYLKLVWLKQRHI